MKPGTLALTIFVLGAISLVYFTSSTRDYALQRFEKAIKKNHSQYLYEDREKRLEGLKELEVLRSKLNNKDTLRYHMAMIRYYRLRHEYPQALLHCERSKELLPQTPQGVRDEAYLWELPLLHGIVLFHLKHYQEALEQLKQASEHNSRSKYIALYLSQIHMALATDDSNQSQKHLNQALEYADQSLKFSQLAPQTPIKSNWAPAWNQRAVVLMRLKDFQSARLDLLEAIRLEPEYVRAQYNLAICSGYLSLFYLKPQTKNKDKATTYRQEAIRSWQELKVLDPVLAEELYLKGGIQNLIEGAIAY